MTNIIKHNILDSKYTIVDKIGEGSFGEVYMVINSLGVQFAAKIENKSSQSRVTIESKVYKYLHTVGACKNIPKIYDYIETLNHNILVMDLLGESLEDVFNSYNKKFRLETVFMIAKQLIYTLYNVHKSTFIHRDIKPNNFLFDKNKEKIYIMDFGLSKKYISKKIHIPFKESKSLIGTARYVSTNMHLGFEPSRRDDMIALGYMLIYFAKGSLPWQGLKKKQNVNSIELIGDKKLSTSSQILCNGLPPCFYNYIEYCKNLLFEETPDYQYLLNLFKNDSEEWDIPIKFEWS